jgi:hypothetical protein
MRYTYTNPQLERDRDEVLRELMDRRGMCTFLARELGISKAAVAQWYSIPEQHVQAISRLLDIPQYRLRGETSPRSKVDV